MCVVCLFDYYEISEWAPEYGPRLSELGLERNRSQEISRKIGFLQFMIAGFGYDWTTMDKE